MSGAVCHPRYDIAVAGDGTVAVVMAAAAAAAGRSCLRIGRAEKMAAASRHYALSASSLKFLTQLGVDMAVHAIPHFALFSGGRRFGLSDSSPLCYLASEAALLSALHRCEKKKAVAVQTAKRVQWQGCDESAVHLRVDGETVRAALLIVADGARSPLAAQLHLGGRVVDFNQTAVVATVAAPSLKDDTAYQWFFDREVIALLPLGHQKKFSLIWSVRHPPADKELSAALSQRIGIKKLLIKGNIGGITRFPLYAQKRAVRCAPRAVVVGDAACSLHPLAGQGLNQGLSDVQALIRCLHGAADCGQRLGLSAYAAARTPQVALLDTLIKTLLDGGTLARTTMLAAAACIPPLRYAAVRFATTPF